MANAEKLFDRLRAIADRPLKADFDVDEILSIEFATDDGEVRDSARRKIEIAFGGIVACAQAAWGRPRFRLVSDGYDMPSWTELLPTGFDLLVGWKRGRGKIAFVLYQQEDRELPIILLVGAVRGK